MNYVEKNQEILDRWEKEYEQKGYNVYFTPDGIMYRGKLWRDEANNWRHDVDGRENELWANSPLRILFLTKDQNGGKDHSDWWDIRGDSYHDPRSDKEENRLFRRYAFNTNIVNVLYGLVTTTPNKMIEFDEIDEKEAVKVSDTYPFARINCKKETGGPECPYHILDKALKEFRPYLKEQIINLDADIFVCCGCYGDKSPILDFLNSIGEYSFEYISYGDYALHYDANKHKIAISLYHLSYRFYSREAMYLDAIKPYYMFLQKHPDFLESHRK